MRQLVACPRTGPRADSGLGAPALAPLSQGLDWRAPTCALTPPQRSQQHEPSGSPCTQDGGWRGTLLCVDLLAQSTTVDEPECLLVSRRQSFEPGRSASRKSATGLPSSLLRRSTRRLQIVSLTIAGLIFVAWFVNALLKGKLHEEWRTPYQWGGPVALLVVSLAVFGLVRFSRGAAQRIESIALSYEVVSSWCMPVITYWRTFRDVPADRISFDLVGFSPVVVWVLLFTVLVPARPTRALIALLLSLAAVPTTYAVLVSLGDAPALDSGRFIGAFVQPYVFVVVLAYVAARIIYGLRRDVRRALEVGSYTLLEPMGEGAMGEVWRAKHQLLARPAAVKLIRRDALGSDPRAAETRIARFEQEAQVTASLRSPNTVQLYDFGVAEDGTLYYVMELLEGVDLESLVKRFGPLPPERAVHLLKQACQSLEEAHHREIIHRDIKPANIFLCQSALDHDLVKVFDFGLVKAQAAVDDAEHCALSGGGEILGTPAFIAPEVALGTDVDGRADIYSLGCVAYWLLTGLHVFAEDTSMAMAVAHVNEEPEPPSARTEQTIPPELDDLVLRCLEKKPADRPRTARELALRLDRIELDNPWTHKRSAAWWARDSSFPVPSVPRDPRLALGSQVR